MGFLNHSTNNIIIDAVLTERGRELLSEGNNSFNITRFSFGDDEVDYSNITKYGLVIGKEKIEKNTPVFEASTNENIALKNKLLTLTLTNTSNFYLPSLRILEGGSAGTPLNQIRQEYTVQDPSPTTVYSQTYINPDITTALDSGVVDNIFIIRFNNDLLEVLDKNNDLQSGDVDQNKIKTIRMSTDDKSGASTGLGLKELIFKVQRKSIFNSNLFSKYGRAGNLDEIATEITITGNSSRASKTISVIITNGTSTS